MFLLVLNRRSIDTAAVVPYLLAIRFVFITTRQAARLDDHRSVQSSAQDQAQLKDELKKTATKQELRSELYSPFRRNPFDAASNEVKRHRSDMAKIRQPQLRH